MVVEENRWFLQFVTVSAATTNIYFNCLLIFYIYQFFHDFFCRSLKLEFEKLANEKTEMQRHYVMVSEIIQFFLNCLSIWNNYFAFYCEKIFFLFFSSGREQQHFCLALTFVPAHGIWYLRGTCSIGQFVKSFVAPFFQQLSSYFDFPAFLSILSCPSTSLRFRHDHTRL